MAEVVMYIGVVLMIISYSMIFAEMIMVGKALQGKLQLHKDPHLMEIGTVLYTFSAILTIIGAFVSSELGQKLISILGA